MWKLPTSTKCVHTHNFLYNTRFYWDSKGVWKMYGKVQAKVFSPRRVELIAHIAY